MVTKTKLSLAERQALKDAKTMHKESLKNPTLAKEKQDRTLKRILNSVSPSWDSLKLDMTEIG